MNTQRLNPPKDWYMDGWFNCNKYFIGFTHLITDVWHTWQERGKEQWNMLEIGAHMGESTMLFASTGMFETIYVIEPFDGMEAFNTTEEMGWDKVKEEFDINTRYFDNIKVYPTYSYKVPHKFEDASLDFIYMDAEHDYDSISRDLDLYLPKLKPNGIIAGHDYNEAYWPGVVKAVDERFGDKVHEFMDTSWIVKL